MIWCLCLFFLFSDPFLIHFSMLMNELHLVKAHTILPQAFPEYHLALLLVHFQLMNNSMIISTSIHSSFLLQMDQESKVFELQQVELLMPYPLWLVQQMTSTHSILETNPLVAMSCDFAHHISLEFWSWYSLDSNG